MSAGTFLTDDNIPQTVLPLASVQQDGPSSAESARNRRLLRDAEMRAEHQAAARNTMLDLATALDEAHSQRRHLARALHDERITSDRLADEVERLEIELNEATAAEEQRKADKIIEAGLKKRNGVFITMMIEKSKEVYRSSHFDSHNKFRGRPESQESGVQESGVCEDEDDTTTRAPTADDRMTITSQSFHSKRAPTAESKMNSSSQSFQRSAEPVFAEDMDDAFREPSEPSGGRRAETAPGSITGGLDTGVDSGVVTEPSRIAAPEFMQQAVDGGSELTHGTEANSHGQHSRELPATMSGGAPPSTDCREPSCQLSRELPTTMSDDVPAPTDWSDKERLGQIASREDAACAPIVNSSSELGAEVTGVAREMASAGEATLVSPPVAAVESTAASQGGGNANVAEVATSGYAPATGSQAVPAGRPKEGQTNNDRSLPLPMNHAECHSSNAGGGRAGESRRSKGSHAKKQKTALGSEGDRVMFMWIMKLWKLEVDRKKEELAAKVAEEEKRRQEEERQRKIQEEIERRVGEVRGQIKVLETALSVADQKMENYQRTIADLERQIEKLNAESNERQQQHQAEKDELKNELLSTQRRLTDTQTELQSVRSEYHGAREEFRIKESEFQSEKKRQQETIRNLTSELHEATVLAKYMREAMLKAKRDAAGSVSPGKFAELIAQLEAMKEKLKSLSQDYETEKDANNDLLTKLEKNKRRLELERQFLPLVRQARGPLGPKATGGIGEVMMSTPAVLADLEASPETTKKLQRSQSLANQRKGFALGDPYTTR